MEDFDEYIRFNFIMVEGRRGLGFGVSCFSVFILVFLLISCLKFGKVFFRFGFFICKGG